MVKFTFRFLTAERPLSLILCLICLAHGIYALNPAKKISQYQKIIYTTEDGLPQGLVNSMVQTRDGYLWFATEVGLARFNGVSFKIFDTANTPTLKSNHISKVFEDSKGRLWVGTIEGLYLYQNGEFTVYSKEQGLASDIIFELYEDKQGDLWIGMSENNIGVIHDGKIISDETRPKLPENAKIRVITEDATGDVWVGTNIGAFRYHDKQLKLFTVSDGLDNNSVQTIYLDPEKKFWVGTEGGLSLFENEKFIGDKRFKGKNISSIKKDRDGSIWVSGNFGLSRIRDGKVETLENNKEVSSKVTPILEDAEGSIWAATYGEGLVQLIDSKFVSLTAADGLLNDYVNSLTQDREGDIWIGTYRGLSRFRQDVFDLKIQTKEFTEEKSSAILADETGDLWVGSWNGLLRWRNGKFVDFKGSEKLANKLIGVLYQDSENNLWIGTDDGLFLYDRKSNGGEIIEFKQSEELAKANLYSIDGSLTNGLWIGTVKGLLYFKDGKITTYLVADAFSNDTVMSIYEDGEVIWLGTYGSGLKRFKDGKFTGLTMKEGLFDDNIFSIRSDNSGYLWMSSNRGIFLVSKNSLDEFMDGRQKSVESVSYGKEDGMKSFEVNGGMQPSTLKTRDGKLWFSTPKGVVMIDPNNIPRNQTPPPVHIENIIVDSKPSAMPDKMNLPAGTQRLEFHFAGLSFVAPKKVKYRYRLVGYDNDWMDGGNDQESFYMNLPHGEYTFQVIAGNNDGVWNEVGDSYSFKIKPFFYQTRWFILCCLGVIMAVITAIHYWRIRIMKLRYNAVLSERTRIARELHDTLLQGFVGVSSQLNVVASQFKESPEIAERHLAVARKMIRYSVTEARRAVQNLRTESDNKTFGEILDESVSRVTNGESIAAEIKVNGKAFDFTSELTYQILHIAEEAVVNSVKHSNGSKISVVCSYDSPNFKLEIIDDGKGFETNNAFSTLKGHFGLLGMKERAEKIGGKLLVENVATGGTKIIFEKTVKPKLLKIPVSKVSAAFRKKPKDQ